MNDLKKLYSEIVTARGDALRDVRWEASGFAFCFSGKAGKAFLMTADAELVELSAERRFLKWRFWDPVAHLHCDEQKDTTEQALRWVLGWFPQTT